MCPDGSGEFDSNVIKACRTAYGIAHEATILYILQQDGKAEVTNWIVIGYTNPMMLEVGDRL